eukprot:scaffold54333_cov62-Phaeocystis_antarctica.AAC.2
MLWSVSLQPQQYTVSVCMPATCQRRARRRGFLRYTPICGPGTLPPHSLAQPPSFDAVLSFSLRLAVQ